MDKIVYKILTVTQCILVVTLIHYGYSVSMTASGMYWIQGYIGTIIPLLTAVLLVISTHIDREV